MTQSPDLFKNQPDLEKIAHGEINKTLARNLLKSYQCSKQYANETTALSERYQNGFCSASFDKVLCWPPTPLNSTVVMKCFKELNNILYDDTKNATRTCMANGSWSRTDYEDCAELLDQNPINEVTWVTTSKIYFVGFTIGLITLAIAVGIFVYFKELRCLRNTIHINLMCAHMLMYIMWMKNAVILLQLENESETGSSRSTFIIYIFLTTFLHYFNLATFFWMFVEGLYLYILVVETLTRENFKLRVYACIGWGLPVIFVTSWVIAKCMLPVDEEIGPVQTWINPHPVDWIHQAPTLIILLLNLIFLVAIMWVLITKLRSANSLETQQSRKAAKALLVLMPLLGVTYIIMIYGPSNKVFENTRAVLLSTQGFSVALFYCFLNTEVQNTLRHHFETWRTNRSLGPSRLRTGSRSKDYSPRSRTESIRDTEWTWVVSDDENEVQTAPMIVLD